MLDQDFVYHLIKKTIIRTDRFTTLQQRIEGIYRQTKAKKKRRGKEISYMKIANYTDQNLQAQLKNLLRSNKLKLKTDKDTTSSIFVILQKNTQNLFKPSQDSCSVLIRYAVMMAALQGTNLKKGVKPLQTGKTKKYKLLQFMPC